MKTHWIISVDGSGGRWLSEVPAFEAEHGDYVLLEGDFGNAIAVVRNIFYDPDDDLKQVLTESYSVVDCAKILREAWSKEDTE